MVIQLQFRLNMLLNMLFGIINIKHLIGSGGLCPPASEIHHYDLDPYQKIFNPPLNTYVPNESNNSFPLDQELTKIAS